MGGGIAPDISEEISLHNNIYILWFNDVVLNISNICFDANNERVMKCMNNCPAEEIAIIIYNSTPKMIQHAFLKSIKNNTVGRVVWLELHLKF